MRIVGGLLTGLLGLAALIVTGGLTGTGLSGYEGWWIFPPIGLPLVGLFFATTWALWTGRRVRPVVGSWLLLAALVWSVFFAILLDALLREIARSTSPLAAIGLVALVPFAPAVIAAAGIAWPLLWRQGVALAPFAFFGIALSWLAAWIRLLASVANAPGLLSPEAGLVYAFFATPLALSLIAGLTLALARPRR